MARVYLPDGWNYCDLSVSRSVDVEGNKSTFTATATLTVARGGQVSSSYGTTVWAHTGSGTNYGSPLYQGSYSYSFSWDMWHDANGYLGSFEVGGGCHGGWGSVMAVENVPAWQIDRSGITISNFTLRDCVNRKLYINFSFNYDPRNTWYRYRKASSSSWETNWIEWGTYGGEYNSGAKTGYFITPKLKANTNYVFEIQAQRNYNGVYTSKSATFYVESSVFLKKNGSWIDGEIYVKKNGAWKKGTVYIKKNGAWKEGG